MPVYDLAYRRVPFERNARGGLGKVARRTLSHSLRSRWTKILFALGWVPALGACAFLYIQSGALAGFGPPGGRSFHYQPFHYHALLNFSRFFVLLFAVAVGAGAIAEDRRLYAFELYFSRPLNRAEYVGGKLLALTALLFAITGLPTLFVWFFDASLVPETEPARFAETAYLVPRLAGYPLLLSASTTLFVLAFSANARSGRHAAVFFAILFLLSQLVAEILGEITGSDAVRALGYWRCFETISREVFELPRSVEAPSFRAASFVLLGACGLALYALRAAVRPTRVVR